MGKIAIIGDFAIFHNGHMRLLEAAKKTASFGQQQIIIFILHSPILRGLKHRKKQLVSRKWWHFVSHFFFPSNVKLVFLPLTKTIKNWTPSQFISHLHRYDISTIIVGQNFRFGKDRSGNIEILQKNNFHVLEICLKKGISTTQVYTQIAANQLSELTQTFPFFGYAGKIIEGTHYARTLGFPTCNINVSNRLLLLPFGVYGGYVYFDGIATRYTGSIIIWKKHNMQVIEVYVHNFNDQMYGKNIFIMPKIYLRKIQYVKQKDKLIELISNDVQMTTKMLS